MNPAGLNKPEADHEPSSTASAFPNRDPGDESDIDLADIENALARVRSTITATETHREKCD